MRAPTRPPTTTPSNPNTELLHSADLAAGAAVTLDPAMARLVAKALERGVRLPHGHCAATIGAHETIIVAGIAEVDGNRISAEVSEIHIIEGE